MGEELPSLVNPALWVTFMKVLLLRMGLPTKQLSITINAKKLDISTPNQVKALSYRINDYDAELWQPVARHTMYKACLLKFQQNPILGLKLKNTSGIIVEANPNDKLFSCGLSLHHPHIQHQEKWPGKNLLGEILCQVRDSL